MAGDRHNEMGEVNSKEAERTTVTEIKQENTTDWGSKG